MKRLVNAAEMREMDRLTIEERGIPGYDLMTAAGQGVADVILDVFDELEDARIVILAGRGNNGGDGFVAARFLEKAELRPVVVLVGATPSMLRGDAARAYQDWTKAGGETLVASDLAAWTKIWRDLEEPDVVVDALLGTGSRGAPEGTVAAAVEALEEVAVPVVSVDIPTGLDADRGRVEGPCVHADLTVTLGLPKRGHFLYPGRSFVGGLEWVDIGIPEDVLARGEGLKAYVVEEDDVVDFLPDREPDMHKGDRGRLLLVGGSPGLTGAVTLAASAAVRAGAGLVTAGIPLGLNDILEVKLTEAMTLPLPQLESRVLSRDAFDAIALFQPGRVSAFAVGPGLGRHPSTQALVRRLIEEIHLPTVLDADGLFAFNGRADLLRMSAAGRRLVITPHAGEFTALTGESPEALHEDRLGTASRWARRLGVILVLKGAPTVIAEPEREYVYVNPTGSEALATGGTGDVLTGLIAGFLAQGLEPIEAAVAAVYLHGWTADCLVDLWGSPYGLQAGDLVEYFPMALGLLLSPLEE